MSTDTAGAATPRSHVRVQRIRGGEHVWQIVVVASDDTPAALREAVQLARELDDELTTVYVAGEPAQLEGEADAIF
jgi:hypothetical protein